MFWSFSRNFYATISLLFISMINRIVHRSMRNKFEFEFNEIEFILRTYCCIIISSMFGIRVFGSCCKMFFFIFFFLLFVKQICYLFSLFHYNYSVKKQNEQRKLQRTCFDENRRLEKFFDIFREKILRLLFIVQIINHRDGTISRYLF